MADMTDQEMIDWLAKLEEAAMRSTDDELVTRANEIEDRGFNNPHLFKSIRVLADSHGTDIMDYVCTQPDWRYMIDVSEEDFDGAVEKVLTLIALENVIMHREDEEMS